MTEETKVEKDNTTAEKYNKLIEATVEYKLPSKHFKALISKLQKDPESFNLDKELEKILPKRIESKSNATVSALIFDLVRKVNKTQIRKSDYIGKTIVDGEVQENWNRNEVTYKVLLKKFENELGYRLPRTDAMVSKIIIQLWYWTQQKAGETIGFITDTHIDFDPKDMVKALGYGELLKKSGKILQVVKHAILSGACTSYYFTEKDKNGKLKKGVAGSIYNCWFTGNKWATDFNAPYRLGILESLNGDRKGQFFSIAMKEINDPDTINELYLHSGYLHSKFNHFFEKGIDIFKAWGVSEKKLARPQECFKIFQGYVIFYNEHYPPYPEIDSVTFKNQKTGKERTILITEAFKWNTYKDLKKILKKIEINDIREAHIKFNPPYRKPVSKELTRDIKETATRILNWLISQGITMNRKDLTSQVISYVKKKTVDKARKVFEKKANGYKPNVVEYYKGEIMATLRNDYTLEIKDNDFSPYRQADVKPLAMTPEEIAEGKARKREAMDNYHNRNKSEYDSPYKKEYRQAD